MSDDKTLKDLELLNATWLIVGLILIALVIGWLVFVFVATRHRKPVTIASLRPQQGAVVDLVALKQKYLALISEVEVQAQQAQITPRQTHQRLSTLVRQFVFDASGFRAQIMTLSDLEKSRYPAVKEVIQKYYPGEFESIVRGDPLEACTVAKGMVQAWA